MSKKFSRWLLIPVLFILIGVFLTLNQISKEQDLRQHAAGCVASGGNGGNAYGAQGITVRGGDGGTGGVGAGGSCAPGTNGVNVDARNYCTTKSIDLSWSPTSTATYYRLLIDNVQVYNGAGFSFNANNYSLQTKHIIVLYAGNSNGDFNPSTGGYFEILNPICTPPTPTLTPTPTRTPTLTKVPPTSTPTPRAPTPIPTKIPTPTTTPIPQTTTLGVTLYLHGLGNSGDNANPDQYSLSNKNPNRKMRSIQVDVYDSTDKLVLSKTGSVIYNSALGNFNGTVNMGTTLTSGNFTVKVKSSYYLKRKIPGIQTITPGITNNLPSVTLITGDINNDNVLSILDYNVLIGCYSDFGPAASCNTDLKLRSDITDDGNVDQFDYNLFLRDFSVQNGD